MAKSKLKIKAHNLRKQGKSIREIVSSLKVPLSTVSYWCRDLSLTKKQQDNLARRQINRSYAGRLKSAEKLKKQRKELTKRLKLEGIDEMGKLTDKELFLAGIGLYWGEGYRSSEVVGFTSKDSKIMKFMIFWFKKFINAKKTDFILRVSVNLDHKKRIDDIEKYWSQTLNVSRKQFIKPSFLKAKQKKFYPDSNNYFGTLRIIVRRSCSRHRKLMGWIEGLFKNIAK